MSYVRFAHHHIEYTPASNKKVWWKCEKKGHEYRMPVYCRSIGKRNSKGDHCFLSCPFCSGRAVCKDNCLATLRPDISEEWHPTKNRFTPEDVTLLSNRKVWWKCKKKGHEFQAQIANRGRGVGGHCPYCSNKKVCIDNCLLTTHPIIAKEWHSKNKIRSSEVTYGSGKKVWWKCRKGHEYLAPVFRKTALKQPAGCPRCSESIGETKIRRYLESRKIKFEMEKTWDDLKYINKVRYDFYLPDYDLLIEYDGYYHFDKDCRYSLGRYEHITKRDKLKTQYAIDNAISLLRISYREFTMLNLLIGEVLKDIGDYPIYIFSNPELYETHEALLYQETY